MAERTKFILDDASYDQKPYRRLMTETFGAKAQASPSELTSPGRAVLAEHPDLSAPQPPYFS
jgi:predicted alternative tryptophan synthase beta-subunit